MSFVFKKKVLSSIMAATMAAGFAVSQNVSAIHVAEDNLGQVLLAPHYRVENGYSTEVTIVNTRADVAVKARVAIRAEVNSPEVVDFICYLTPTDVCRFELVEENGRVILKSSDDSIKSESSAPVTVNGQVMPLIDTLASANAVWASARPLSFPVPLNRVNNDANAVRRGHIEVVAAYAVSGTVNGYRRNGTVVPVNIVPGMSKYDLAAIFDAPRTTRDFSNQIHVPLAAGLTLALGELNPPGITDEAIDRGTGTNSPYGPLAATTNIRSTDPTWVQLKGTVTVKSATDRYSYEIPALAGSLGDTVGSGYLQPTTSLGTTIPGVNPVESIFDGLVISNPFFDISVASITGVGNNFGIRVAGGASPVFPAPIAGIADKVVEIERAIAFTSSIGEYKLDEGDGSAIVVTFPLRYQHAPGQPNRCGAGVSATTFSPPFRPDGAVPAAIAMFDDFENTVTSGRIFSGPEPTPLLLVEGNYFTPEWANFAKGWYSLVPTAMPGCPYLGMPGFAFTHVFKGTGSQITQSMINRNSHTPVMACSDVTGTTLPSCNAL